MTDDYPIPLRPEERADWPASWRESYYYDCVEVWDDPACINLASVGYISAYKARRNATIEALLAAAPPPAHVLDLAAAQGNFTAAFAGLGYRVTWNDLRAELGEYTRMKLPAGSGVDFVAGNIFELGDAHVGRYDAVVALEVIEHVAHPDQFMAKLATLLRPGGVLVMSTPNGGYFLNTLPRFSDHPDPSVFESTQFKPNSDGHIFLLHEDELRRFAQSCGLEVRRLETFTNPLTAGHIKLRYALRVLPTRLVKALEWMTSCLPGSLRRRLNAHTIMVVCKPGG